MELNISDYINFAKVLNFVIIKNKLNLFLININSDVTSKDDIIKNVTDSVKKLLNENNENKIDNIKKQLIDKMKELKDFSKKYTKSYGPDYNKPWLMGQWIINYIKKYEKIINDFKFIGTLWSNCVDIDGCPLNNFNFDEYYDNKIYQLGIVFNSTELTAKNYINPKGKHWISLYINLSTGMICFFDSGGKLPKNGIFKFMNKFTNWYKSKFNKDPTIKINKKKIQNDKTECGIYSINFLLRMIAGQPFEYVISNSLNYPEIVTCRHQYYNGKTDPKVSNLTPHFQCNPFLLST